MPVPVCCHKRQRSAPDPPIGWADSSDKIIYVDCGYYYLKLTMHQLRRFHLPDGQTIVDDVEVATPVPLRSRSWLVLLLTRLTSAV